MAFCKYCGKQIEEGQVCSCQQTAQPQAQPTYAAPAQPQAPAAPSAAGKMFKMIWEHTKGSFKNPFDAAKAYYQNGTFGTTGIIVGILALVYMIASVFRLIPMGHYGDFEHVKVDGAMVAKTIFFPLVYLIVMLLAVFVMGYVISMMNKKEFNLKKTFNLVGAVSIPIICALILQLFVNFIEVEALKLIFGIGITIFTFIALIQGLLVLKDEVTEGKSFLLQMIVGIIILSVFSILIGLLMRTSFTYFNFPSPINLQSWTINSTPKVKGVSSVKDLGNMSDMSGLSDMFSKFGF